MKDNNLEQLKNNYMEVPVPKELDSIVKKALNKSRKNLRKSRFKKIRISAASIAAAIVIIAVGVNTSTVLAKTLSEVPVIGNVIKVLTFTKYTIKEDTFNADIKVPVIQGLKDKKFENTLNDKYLDENKKLYEEFKADMEELKEIGKGGHLGVDSGFVIKTDNDRILSVGRYIVNMVGSSSTVFKYDTIDKKEEILITLPSLFKNDKYINIISGNIKEQMLKKHKQDDSNFYWVEGIEEESPFDLFEKISKDQSFYIDPNNKLVISFDKYEVAPGYMGVVEFVIPTEILKDILVSNEYIK